MVCGPSRRLFVSFAAQPLRLYPVPCCRPSAATRRASKWARSASTSASQATMSPTNPRGKEIGTVVWFFVREGLHKTHKSKCYASSPFRRAFKRQCTEDGSWLEGACEPVTCDPPPPIFHGSYHCTDGFRFDSICRLNCSDPAGNTAIAATGGSAHTVRLLHAPCKQVCPSLSSLSILALPICSSFCHVC